MSSANSPRIIQYEAAGGYRPCARVWDVAAPRGRVVLVHGIISHGGWYLESCRALAAAGFETHFLDRRGSGLNAAGRGDVDDYQTWIEDVEVYLNGLGSNLPRHLLGISWGGKLAIAVAKHSPQLLDSVGMLCPGMFAPRAPGPVQRALVSTAVRAGLGGFKATIPLKDPALFTESPRWQAYIRHDPLTLRRVTLRLARQDAQLDRYVADAASAVTVPALLALAGRDRISDNRRLRQFFDQLASPTKKRLEYPAAAHTLEFEAQPERYFADLVDWLSSQSSAASGSI
jgi:alpha-beta hydrolase superfamily lysophospholipase